MGSLDAGDSPGTEPGRSPAAEDDAMRDLGTERVRHLLSLLSTDQRCVLALRVVADLSVEDVAVALDKPPGRSRLCSAGPWPRCDVPCPRRG